MKGRVDAARDLRLFLLMGVACLVLLVLLLDEKAGLAETLGRCRDLEGRLERAVKVVEGRKDLFASLASRAAGGLPPGKSLRTLVMDAAGEAGVEGRLEAVFPSVDRMRKVARARVSFRGLTLREVVRFFLRLKNLSPLVRDREASLRMQGYNQDRWRLDVTLEAPLPAAEGRNGGPAR